MHTGAGNDQISDSSQAGKGLRASSHGSTKPGDLGNASGDQCSLCVYHRSLSRPQSRSKGDYILSAPPSSIPSISGLVYTRNTGLINRFCTSSASCLLCAPATQVVGSPLLTSSAWLGPERTVTLAAGSSSSMISDRFLRVVSSIPLATLVMTCLPLKREPSCAPFPSHKPMEPKEPEAPYPS